METSERNKILEQLLWDYNISVKDVHDVLLGKKELAGHYTQEMLFQKILESYSWFTIIQLLAPKDIQRLLTRQAISKLRSPSLRKKYEFVRERLQEIIPVAG